ncbi:MAG: TssN family type VI secretion system protein [Saprospiraceae bacterium]
MSTDILQSQIAKPRSKFREWFSNYKNELIYYVVFIAIVLLWNKLYIIKHYGDNNSFVISQIVFFVFGIAHVYFLYKYCKWANDNKLWAETIFTIGLLLVGFLLIKFRGSIPWINKGVNPGDFKDALFSTSALPFILPFLFKKAFDYWEAIPEKSFKDWQYPAGMEPPTIQSAGQVSVKFNLDLNKEGTSVKTIKKYDLDLEKSLGEHLQFFIYDFNANTQDGKTILIADADSNDPYKWVFKMNRPLLPMKILDHDLPVKDLNLKTGDTIDIDNV